MNDAMSTISPDIRPRVVFFCSSHPFVFTSNKPYPVANPNCLTIILSRKHCHLSGPCKDTLNSTFLGRVFVQVRYKTASALFLLL
jgi:hypothetical protein